MLAILILHTHVQYCRSSMLHVNQEQTKYLLRVHKNHIELNYYREFLQLVITKN